tara:strand:+ start:180 stop:647 length:468 start_codon:yes stop_codon:yes gene_type:complete
MEEEENNQERKATKEDVVALAEAMGIEKSTCSWNNPVNKFVHMINTLFMHDLSSDRVNQDCLMILIGQPMNQLEAIEKSYLAFKKSIDEQRENYKNESKRRTKTEEKLERVSFRNTHIERSNRFARVIAEMAIADNSRLSHAIREAEYMFRFDDE